MDILSIIEKKRDKKKLTKEEIEFFIKEYTLGNVPDYKAAALIMAIYLNGMDEEETANLTMAMAYSGDTLDLTDISDNIIDKHSTGGVGDKVTIIFMPIIASLGIPVAKMSGRGLGFTGGTADKLESIPGYRVDIPIPEFKENVKKIGISIVTSSMDLVPADKKIYALRDLIGCVSNIPLIASSIMSKKIAAGANKVVIELMCGDGAFMKNIDEARLLADTMIKIGNNVGKEIKCVITNMDEPIGYSVGNSLEIIEAVEFLNGKMEKDVEEIVYALAAETIIFAGKTDNKEDAYKMIKEAIESKKALEKFRELVINQGGDISYIDNLDKFEKAKYIVPVLAKEDGYIEKIHTEEIGRISSFIGAGRVNKDDKIDMEAGIIINKKIGDTIKKDEVLAYIHTNKEEKIEEALQRLQKSFIINKQKTEKCKTILESL